ncbi:MAG: DHH family phosphoesterase [Slackia sp.]|nr:DHH family phosphoesterase [Slackia sp.]
MAVTPQTNTTLEAMADCMRECDDFVLCGHVNPDGDCLGSQLALMHALRSMGKRAVCVLVEPDSVDLGLRFLPGVEEMDAASDFKGSVGAFVACDVPTTARIGAAAGIQEQARVRFTLDHHAADVSMSEFNYVDPDAPACGMIAWELVKLLVGEDIPEESATCCYTALMTDTGRFQYQNTTPDALRAATEMVEAGADPAFVSSEVYQSRSFASLMLEKTMLENATVAEDGLWSFSYLRKSDFDRLGAVKADAEPLVDVVRSLAGVRVACMLREQADGVRGSLRAKGDEVDVSELARHIGGGGHRAAAGFTFEGTLDEALDAMPTYLDELVAKAGLR